MPNGSAAIISFYFQTNEAGKPHWHYMDERRMAALFTEHLAQTDRHSDAADAARLWLRQRVQA